MSVRQAAAYLAVSPDTVRALVARGDLPRVALPGVRRVLIATTDVDRLIEAARSSLLLPVH
jgi:excisionase family DNA binding protein